MTDLGPVTESRFAAAFAGGAIITQKAAAALIGLDVKTLDALSDDQVVRAVRRGAYRAYTERDLRAYLTEGPDVCRSTSPPKAATMKQGKVVAFSALQARRPDVPRPRRHLHAKP